MGTVMRILDLEQNSDAEDVPRRRDAGAAGVVKRHQEPRQASLTGRV